MTSILDRIIATKRAELERSRAARPLSELHSRAADAEPARNFFSAVTAPSPRGIHLIAELKKGSPSAGLLVEAYDPAEIAGEYHRHAASALSVLTDRTFFQGSLHDVAVVKQAVPLPVLRKDFIIDSYQVHESRAAGADAILLIADVLEADQIFELHGLAGSLGMTTLIESHGADVLAKVLAVLDPPRAGRLLVGINNRDLAAQKTNLDVTRQLAVQLPPDIPFVAESGIATRQDVLAMQDAGACAILVGESLLRAPDIGTHIDALLGSPSR